MPRKSSASPARGSSVFAGTSGWAYASWKPGFYPEGVSAKRFLNFYASQLNSVEVNYTFTKLPTRVQVEGWLAQTPVSFRFSFKAPQRITHYSRLVACEGHVAEFLEAIRPVQEAGRLGLLLFQLPPNFKVNLERLRGLLAVEALREFRVAFEFRHESWFVPEVFAVLAEFDAALCVAETESFVTPEVHTAKGFTAFRLRQSGGYKPRQVAALAERIMTLAGTREVYAYFKHEDEPTGALNARAFLKACARQAAQ